MLNDVCRFYSQGFLNEALNEKLQMLSRFADVCWVGGRTSAPM